MKNVVRTACAIFLLSACVAAHCCQIGSDQERAAHDAKDIADQTALVRTLFGRADAIFTARVDSVSEDAGQASFTVERIFKGKPDSKLRLPLQEELKTIVVSCYMADAFQVIRVVPGREYLVYLQGTQILRAGATGSRLERQIPYSQERDMIRQLTRNAVQ